MFAYIGGKCKIAKWIISNFPQNYKNMTYVEVFGGAGWVLFKKEPSLVEVYNDNDELLVNLFIVLRDHFQEFKRRAKRTLHSRRQYQMAIEQLKAGYFRDNIDKALLYAITVVQSFSGTRNSWGYYISANNRKTSSTRWLPFLRKLNQIRKRLSTVQIECLDFRKVIEKYDTPNTLFYLDPPYVQKEHYYRIGFTEKDHRDLAEILKNIKGKFVLSYYPCELVEKLYKGFNWHTKEVSKPSYGVTVYSKVRSRPRGTELLIKNY
ncbi:DNA adenine methylase [Balnearium lithotrophicum]|uniref:DNA adenine methylase n=1 Tax=Balnearium lithotrophicum TaxID=223788 RepID=A0A521ELW1_9BACT|nr:DNA adenine methylase [Balnearium lithotrophicum]SMO84909.1 DNA adenine methylase [Balnearium lithotrophicum]